MKEATGEANVTVITIVLIAIVLAVGTVIVSSALNSSKKSSCCSSVGGYYKGARCYMDKAAADAEDSGKTFTANGENGYAACLNDSGEA